MNTMRHTTPSLSRCLAVAATLAWLPACSEDDPAPAAAAQGDASDGHDHDHDHTPIPSEFDASAPPPDGSVVGGFRWDLPTGFPRPVVPEDNPMSLAKVDLGRRLFYDVRLSHNGTFSCASCHEQRLAFTDGKATAVGSTGEAHPRSSMSLANVGYAASLTWADDTQTALEAQARVPMFGTAPIELGLTDDGELEDRLSGVPLYTELFASAFPGEPAPITVTNVTRALAAFQRTLISGNSRFDRWQRDPTAPYSDSEKRGYELFSQSEDFECFHCHDGFNRSDHVQYEGQAFTDLLYHNTGLYDVDGKGAYPAPNTGLYRVTGRPTDMGRFKAPTLRNVAVTAPYMHDGSIATLSEVLDHYAAGGRTIPSGPNAGVGSKNPYKDKLIRGFTLSDRDRADLIAFLESLTDEEFLTNPAFSDPWQTAD